MILDLLLAGGVVALFVLLDKAADALWARYRHRLSRGGLVGWLWRRLTGATTRR
jgi:hypothetical protein